MKVDLSGLSVMIGMPTHRPIPVPTVNSLGATILALAKVGVDFRVEAQHGSSRVDHARNKLAHSFLNSVCNRLFWVDSDMDWHPDDFLKILAKSKELDVVGACYPLKKDPIKFCINGDFKSGSVEVNEHGCLSVDSFGLGFTCVSRQAMLDIASTRPTTLLPDLGGTVCAEIFHIGSIPTEKSEAAGADGESTGEDVHFFRDLKQLGYDVWMDPTIRLGHVGEKVYTASFSELLEKI